MRMHIRDQAWHSYGGLGPDLSRDDIVQRVFLKQKVRGFSDDLRVKNKSRILSEVNRTKPAEVPREPSRRDRALKFAKHIPKPVRNITHEASRPVPSKVDGAGVDDVPLSRLISRFDELTPLVEAIRSKYSLLHDT